MSANTEEFLRFVLDQMKEVEALACGRFFGGNGVASEAVQFAMAFGNTLYFVVDDTTRPKYEEEGSECFSYRTSEREVMVRRYYEVPAMALENRDILIEWAREAIAIAKRTHKKSRANARSKRRAK
jgi:DNA transformation protein